MIRTGRRFGRYRVYALSCLKEVFKISYSKLFPAVFIAVLLSGCSLGKGKPEHIGKPSANDGEGVRIEDRASKFSKQFGITLSDNVKKAALEAVDGSASSGLATFDDAKGVQLVTVLANLPNPERKEKYTVRLISNDKPILLGMLTVAKGGWMIEKQVHVDQNIYRTVEVLKGTQIVLKGSF